MVGLMAREEKLTNPLSVRFTDSVRRQIKDLADKSGRSENGVVQSVVEEWLARNKQNPELGVRLLGIPDWQMRASRPSEVKKSPESSRR